MGVKIKRIKKRNFLVSFAYLLKRLLPLSPKNKLKLFLDLEWIFNRFSHEASFNYYHPDEHPVRITTLSFILNEITETDRVLDLGSKYGDLAYQISRKAEFVCGIDYEKESIEQAQKKYKNENLVFICDDAFNYVKTEMSSYSVLILSHILEHIDNPLEFLKIYKPYFKKTYIEIPDFDSTHLNRYRLDSQSSLIYTDADHVFEFDRDEIKDMIEKSGMIVYKSEYRYGLQKYWCHNNG